MPRPKRRGGQDASRLPSWVGTFVPADWAEPDAAGQSMIEACPSMRPWPDHLREWHSRRRWGEARNAWLDAHPEHDHRVGELLAELGADPADFGVAGD